MPLEPDTSAKLPGRLRLRAGTAADYRLLTRHHYRAKKPATFCRIVACEFVPDSGDPPRVVGVAVLSWPVPMLAARNRHFAVARGYGERLRFANAHVRTLSRVIVHPQFRAAGVATLLVRALLDGAPTRYVETSAAMARYAGFLAGAGFRLISDAPAEPAYLLFDSHAKGTR